MCLAALQTSTSDRDEATSFVKTIGVLADGKKVLADEAGKRATGDAHVMASLQKSMTAIQGMILENFGTA